jgi:ribosome biogenesis protein SSF1/2
VLRKKGELKDGSESEEENDGLGEWDDEEDVSDEEGAEADVSSGDEESSEDERPAKKIKMSRKS